MNQQTHYGTWIRTKKVLIFWGLAAVTLSLGVLSILTPWFLLLLVSAFVIAYIAVIVTLTHWRFSPRGGDYQNKIHDLIVTYKKAPGDAVDLGCGSGKLIIKIGKIDRASKHLGLDYWGKNWEYSRGQCQANAQIEGIDNVEFVQASAARTGLDDERFAYVVSCLTFHEVRDQPDRSQLVAEALRILRRGGTYIFFDLFDDKRHYPSSDEILKTIELAGCTITTNARLSEHMSLPFPLNHKNALRYARLLSGQKAAARQQRPT